LLAFNGSGFVIFRNLPISPERTKREITTVENIQNVTWIRVVVINLDFVTLTVVLLFLFY